MSENALSVINQAGSLLSRAKTLEETLDVMDKATAIAAYSRAKGANGVHQQALELKLRAERKAGQFLKDTPKQRPGEYKRLHHATVQPSLREIGIDRTESSRWQKLAGIPEKKFESYLEESTKKTQNALLHLAKEVTASETPVPSQIELPKGEYSIILADPPWPYEQTSVRGAAKKHYRIMTLEDIKQIKIPASSDSILFLWATNPLLREALEVMASWGFEYKTNIAWIKDKIGNGFYV